MTLMREIIRNINMSTTFYGVKVWGQAIKKAEGFKTNA